MCLEASFRWNNCQCNNYQTTNALNKILETFRFEKHKSEMFFFCLAQMVKTLKEISDSDSLDQIELP